MLTQHCIVRFGIDLHALQDVVEDKGGLEQAVHALEVSLRVQLQRLAHIFHA
jgi:hypothetical protein